MSLRHWWPLDGDLYDRVGNNHLQFVNNKGYIQSTESGNFGPCYERTATGQSDLLRSTNPIEPFEQESICGWFYVTKYAATGTANGLVTHHDHKQNSGFGIGMYTADGSKYYVSVNAGNGTGRIHSDSNYRGSTDIKDAWHHICLTYAADGKIRMYVDGKEDMTPRTFALHNIEDYFDLFNWSTGHYTNSSYRPVCKMSDIRIYDHALSPGEVQELAKGLALHYNFNQLYSKNICNWRDVSTCAHTGWTGNIKYENEVLTLTATNGWRSFMWDIGDSNIGKPITFSYEYRVVDTSNAGYIYVQNHTASGYGSSIQDLSLNTPEWTSKSITANSANKYIGFNVRGTDNTGLNLIIQVRNIKIALNSYDTIYSEYNALPSRCPDDSGRNHNGTYYQVSDSNDIQRGSRSALFNGNYSYIESPNFKLNLPNEDYTIAFWIKPKENGIRDVIYGNHANSTHSFNIERHTGNQLRIYYNGDTPGYITNVKMLANEWTHIVIVRQGNVIQVWRNGVKVSENTYSLQTLTCSNAYYKLGSDYRKAINSTEATRFNGLLDDFRIYITALNEQSIKDLYEPAIYMTNNDVLMAGEFLEDEEAEMTNKNVVKASHLYEDIYKDYELLEYLQSTGTQYINSTYIPKTDFKIELDMMWTGSTIGNFESFAGFMHSSTNPRAGIHKYSSKLMFGGNATTTSGVAPVKNERMIYAGDFTSGAQALYKNGNLIATNKTSCDYSANTQSLYIFCRNASSKNLSHMRLYGGRIYENGILIQDLIPCRRKSDDVLGVYDRITASFYTNAGSGSFTAGPTITGDKISIYASKAISAKEHMEI